MVLVMAKPVPAVRTNFGVFVGLVRMKATARTSAAMTSATALACPTAFVRLNFFTFTDSSVLQGVGKKTDHLCRPDGQAAGSMPHGPAFRPS